MAAAAVVDTRVSVVVLLVTVEDVVGRVVTVVAGFAVAAGFVTSEETVRDVSEDTGLAVVEEAGRDTDDDVFVRAALGVTVELLVETGRETEVEELFRVTGVTVEEEVGRDTDDDGAEVLDVVLEDVAGGLLTEVEEVGLDVVCAFW